MITLRQPMIQGLRAFIICQRIPTDFARPPFGSVRREARLQAKPSAPVP